MNATTLLYCLCTASAFYQIVALYAVVRQILRKTALAKLLFTGKQPGVSILKPVKDFDQDLEAAIYSHATQQYEPFELLLGARKPTAETVAKVLEMAAKFPKAAIRMVICHADAPNPKVAVLADLENEARYPLRIVNDSDIVVPTGYLAHVLEPLKDPKIGLVTCIYRARANEWPAQWEALGIATDFAPSALVAPLFGVNEFGLGSTLAFRKSDLERIGGFQGVSEYLADDFQIGCRISRLGLKVQLSPAVVETSLSGGSWGEVWRHQVRWARTIRFSKGSGYLGLPISNASLWAVIAWLTGHWVLAATLLALRLVMGITAGAGLLECKITVRLWPLMPLRDVWGFAVWIAGLFGSEVDWRGKNLVLNRDGRIERRISP